MHSITLILPHYRLFKRFLALDSINVSFYRFSRFIGNFATYIFPAIFLPISAIINKIKNKPIFSLFQPL